MKPTNKIILYTPILSMASKADPAIIAHGVATAHPIFMSFSSIITRYQKQEKQFGYTMSAY